MTASHDDEKLADLITRYGHAGYGVWWLVVEIVAARVESDGKAEVTYPVSKWSHLLSVRGSLVRHCLSKLEVTHLVTVEWTDSDITVRIPNLLKYRDEYSRKSGHTPDIVRTKEQIQKQIQNIPPTPSAEPDQIKTALLRIAAQIHGRHPKRKNLTTAGVAGKLEQIMKFKKLPKPEWEATAEKINLNHEAWCSSADWGKEDGQFVKNLKSWLLAPGLEYDQPPPHTNGTSAPHRSASMTPELWAKWYPVEKGP